MSKEIFLLDSSALITPSRTYYPFDFAPNFWIQIETKIKEGSIVVLDMVRDEILNGKGVDDLKIWMQELTFVKCINHKKLEFVEMYGNILQYIKDAPIYTQNALEEWSKINVADPWLIAVAAVDNYTLITLERPNNSLNEKIPSDVAEKFSVKTENLFYLMRALNIKI